jgi:hypothetical protein
MILGINSERDKEKVKAWIDSLNTTKKYIVDVKVKRERRTVNQNSLYWLYMACIQDETGEHKDNLHAYFKTKFLGVDERQCFGHRFFLPNTTTSLDTKQFTYYIERVKQFASAELGISLPDPKDLYWEEFYKHYRDFI